MRPNWNISLFHYRNQGADYGRILVGLQVPAADDDGIVRRIPCARSICPHVDETAEPGRIDCSCGADVCAAAWAGCRYPKTSVIYGRGPGRSYRSSYFYSSKCGAQRGRITVQAAEAHPFLLERRQSRSWFRWAPKRRRLFRASRCGRRPQRSTRPRIDLPLPTRIRPRGLDHRPAINAAP